MSRNRIRTLEAEKIIHEEAARRVELRSNKQLAQLLEAKGVKLSLWYIANLVQEEAARIRETRGKRGDSNVSQERG